MTQRIEFIRQVLTEFNKQGIQYCILRNYEFLLREGIPEDIESMDTLIAKEDLPEVDKILNGMGFTQRTQQFSLTHKAYFTLVNLEKVSFDIQVGGVHWNDMRYLGECILTNRTKKEFFYVPSDNDTYVMLLVHSILGKRFFKPKYQKILSSLKVDEKVVYKKLTKIFNNRTAKDLMIAVRNNEYSKIKPYPILTRYILKRGRLFIFIPLFFRWMRQRKNPFDLGPLISIVGPDGAGKSTMVNALNSHLVKSGRKTHIIYTGRGRDHILPITVIGRKYKRREKIRDGLRGEGLERKKDERKKKGKSNRRKLLYTLAAPIFTLDLYLRYIFRILPKRFHRNIVITDRYCSDIILMENAPFWLKRIFLSLFPKPSISIFLYNSPEILHNRRPEESVNELERQMKIFRKFDYSLELKSTDEKKDSTTTVEFVTTHLLRNWQ